MSSCNDRLWVEEGGGFAKPYNIIFNGWKVWDLLKLFFRGFASYDEKKVE